MNKLIFLGLNNSALSHLCNARPEIKEEIEGAIAVILPGTMREVTPLQLSCLIKNELDSETKNLFIIVDDASVENLYRQGPDVLDGELSIKHYLNHYWLSTDTQLHLISFSTSHNVLHRTTWTRNGKNHSTTQLEKSA